MGEGCAAGGDRARESGCHVSPPPAPGALALLCSAAFSVPLTIVSVDLACPGRHRRCGLCIPRLKPPSPRETLSRDVSQEALPRGKLAGLSAGRGAAAAAPGAPCISPCSATGLGLQQALVPVTKEPVPDRRRPWGQVCLRPQQLRCVPMPPREGGGQPVEESTLLEAPNLSLHQDSSVPAAPSPSPGAAVSAAALGSAAAGPGTSPNVAPPPALLPPAPAGVRTPSPGPGNPGPLLLLTAAPLFMCC